MAIRMVIAVCTLFLFGGMAAFAQIIPDPPSRIPAPLPPPPAPPVINGPLQQGPPPGVYLPPTLETYGDRLTTCLHEGRGDGLRGKRLQAYARRCANGN